MPTLVHTLPLSPTWNGRPDPLGGAANGFLVETSHVTLQGLKILGMPVVESPRPGLIRRLYGISRLRRDLEDLEVAQCLFAGDEVTNPHHVAIIANGNGINVHHCVFFGPGRRGRPRRPAGRCRTDEAAGAGPVQGRGLLLRRQSQARGERDGSQAGVH